MVKKPLEDYEDRKVEFSFIPPPPSFILPDWATPCSPSDESMKSSTFVLSQITDKESSQCVETAQSSQTVCVEESSTVNDVDQIEESSPSDQVMESSPVHVVDESSTDKNDRIVLKLRVPRPSFEAPPQASSTLRSEYNLCERSPIILRLSQQRLSKPAKKKARLSSSLGVICAYCAEPVTNLDLKSKNNLVQCSNHKVHKYCQQECLEAHSNYF